uniref:Uncharacterized protein n=1 Tax=Parascaris univalens TaxID=6257 RepID=A0A915A3Y5_PARUN
MVQGQHRGPQCTWEMLYRCHLKVNILRFSSSSHRHLTPALMISTYDSTVRIFRTSSHSGTCSPLFMMINTTMNLGKVTVLSKNLRKA